MIRPRRQDEANVDKDAEVEAVEEPESGAIAVLLQCFVFIWRCVVEVASDADANPGTESVTLADADACIQVEVSRLCEGRCLVCLKLRALASGTEQVQQKLEVFLVWIAICEILELKIGEKGQLCRWRTLQDLIGPISVVIDM